MESETAATSPSTWPGQDNPLGATWNGQGTNFALFGGAAEGVDLVLFDDDGGEEVHELKEQTDLVWHGFVDKVGPGRLYGFRVHGRYAAEEGLRFNPNKLLVDPYAQAISGRFRWGPALLGYAPGSEGDVPSDLDSATAMPRGVVVNKHFPWGDDQRPHTDWADTVIYEAHVKGFTHLHPDIPEDLRGTYAALGHPAAIDHLRGLGVTAVELMPVHHWIDGGHLVDKGLVNYWGYDSVGYFAPEARYSSSGDRGDQVSEFKAMVRALHAAGLEVILDVVYNHTGEGDHLGPTINLKGIDNPAYYRLSDEDRRLYFDVTGTGNSLNVRNPQTLQLIMDSLRYWVTEMHVDGFRFDLASALARQFYEVDRLSAFFDIIHQDPVLSQVKLVAEPWDVGEGGYQVGNFPVRWAEWNGRFRDTVRDYWRGGTGVTDLAYRLTGSSDLYQDDRRAPSASINFVTCHDGFTLRDLVTYEQKRNQANGEGNRDGSDDNRAWNCGVEGETDDPAVLALRARQRRNLLATVILSQGCPMLLHGDELGRTQAGNNNAYGQDNEISWISWESIDADMLDFTRRLIALRNGQPVLRRKRFFSGQAIQGSGRKDIAWFLPSGVEFSDKEWQDSNQRSIAMILNGEEIPDRGPRGEPIAGDSLMVMLHAADDDIEWVIPDGWGQEWEVALDTAGEREDSARALSVGGRVAVTGHSLVVLRHPH
ncbi:MAG: glycogen debranching protein GlgX [Candidatus Dormiibacterota bacterium]